jgi:fibronectin type 3 domain-containing protein
MDSILNIRKGIKMNKLFIFIILSMFVLIPTGLLAGDSLYGLSGDVALDGSTFILLLWSHEENVAGYNLYRKDTPTGKFPDEPLNPKPLVPWSDCNRIKSIIPYGSEEWNAISTALSKPVEKEDEKEMLKGIKGSVIDKNIIKESSVAPSKKTVPYSSVEVDKSMIGSKSVPVESYKDASKTAVLKTDVVKASILDGINREMLQLNVIPFNPCNISEVFDTTKDFEVLQALASAYWRIALVMGWAFVDDDVAVGTTYYYELRAVDKNNTERVLGNAQITAGSPVVLPAPSNVTAEPGDHSVLLKWDEMDHAFSFEVFRSNISNPMIVGKRVNAALIPAQCSTATGIYNCFEDFMHTDDNGYPTKHLVENDSIDGPFVGTDYYYRVRALDLLGREGSFSSPESESPYDSTNPAVPRDITVVPRGDSLQIKWFKVTRDVVGRIDSIQNYTVYRGDSVGDPSPMGIGTAGQVSPDSSYVYFMYCASDLRPAFGEKVFWYRIKATDVYGNSGHLSSPVAGYMSDTNAPDPPVNLTAKGFEEYIKLSWDKNPEPDMGGYNVYRGVCGWDSICKRGHEERECFEWEYIPYPMFLIGNIDDKDSTVYEDRGVPLTSPICYRYSVKAFDMTQNASDTSRNVCQRLREKTPPHPPVISGLKARDGAIKVEWVAPPVQDLFGFIVERADDTTGPWKRINDELKFPEVVECEDIPVTNAWASDSIFSFLDTTVLTQKIYYYRIKGADCGGNIGDPSAYVETYTFDFSGPPTPTNVAVTPVSGECALKIEWEPNFEAENFGFVIFRSLSSDKGYLQMSPVIKGNEFIDRKITAGKQYYYSIQYFGKDGSSSSLSAPASGTVTP